MIVVTKWGTRSLKLMLSLTKHTEYNIPTLHPSDMGDHRRPRGRRLRQGAQGAAPPAAGRAAGGGQDLRAGDGGRAGRLHGGDRHPLRGLARERHQALRGVLLPEQALGK